ncbi:hypothetical protein [Halarchaeum salinum]|uniref:Restriction endonuclease n=1 Tax=Halarchaeum salinum TaxID=489912 RepID=A0AAV3S8K1_9EURY
MSTEDTTTTPSESAAAEIEKIEDSEDYVQRRRLKEIYDARESIREKRRQIDIMIEDPDYPRVDKYRGARLYRSAVEDYIMAVEPLLVNTYAEDGTAYWEDVELGTIQMQPPEHLRGDVEPSPFNDYLRIVEKPTPKEFAITGLQSILGLPRPLTADFSATVRTQSQPDPHQTTKTITQPIPWDILVSAVRQTTLFLEEIGFEVDVSEEEQRTEITDDLVEEVQEWRGENL